jgi:hypothetical protein
VQIIAGMAVAILFVLALLSWRIDAIPRRIVALIKNERVRDEGQAQAILMEAAALKLGPLLAGIRTYHEQMNASLRAQIADAEMRARMSERRASDATTYLGAASTLVAELRALHEASEKIGPAAPALPAEPALVAAGLASRRQRSPAGTPSMEDSGDWPHSERPSDPEGERTRVGPRPSPGALGVPEPSIPSRKPPAVKPTLLSMPAVAMPASRPDPRVEIEIPAGSPR